MRPADVLVEIRDEGLNRVAQLGSEDILSATFAPTMLDVGVWQVVLPHLIVDPVTNRKTRNPKADALRTPGFGLVVTTPGGVFLSGPTTKSTLTVNAEFPGGVWTVEGVSDLVTVYGVTVWGAPTTYTLASQVGAVDGKTDEAETLFYWYANRNRGPSAVTEREDPFLTMATDLGRGPVLKKAPLPFQPIPDLFAEIAREAYAATGIRMNVDVVQVGAGLEFRVIVADDRTAEIRFDFEHGLLDEVTYVTAAPQVTEAVAGETVLRRKALGSNPWGFRFETYVNDSSTDTTEVDQAADAALVEAQEDAVSFSAVATDDAGRMPGVDYNVGDLVTVVVPGATDDIEIAVPVTGTLIHMTPEGVTAGMVLGSPTGNSWQDLISLKQQRLNARLSRLERK